MEYDRDFLAYYPVERRSGLRLGVHAMTGAIVAAFLAALWVVNYLIMSDLWDDVTLSPGMIATHSGGKAMFIVISRFIVGFGLAWAILTFGLVSYAWLSKNNRPWPRIEEDQDPRL